MRFTTLSDPFSMMTAFEKQMNQIFDAPSRRPFTTPTRVASELGLEDRGEALVVTASVPGIRREEIDIMVEGDVLTLKGERKTDAPEGYRLVRAERGALRLFRQVELPCRVSADAASADLSNGVLTITLPKAPEARPRKIAIHSSDPANNVASA
jgi:HSP20 family protein